ncbi:MAG TPA: SRPBCC family protein [Solirubrobacterales bacterium]|nr:SRPBCC family protein [Solirubrobacterales bacterium]
MKPVTVSATVAKPLAEVYEFLDVLANHEGFNDHMLVDWSFSGPARGVGAKARARANTVGSQDWTDFELVEAEAPSRIVEEGVGAGGKRRTRGTYRLEELPGGGTRISFELEWLQVSRAERLAPPLIRAFVRRTSGKAMRRLAKQLSPT